MLKTRKLKRKGKVMLVMNDRRGVLNPRWGRCDKLASCSCARLGTVEHLAECSRCPCCGSGNDHEEQVDSGHTGPIAAMKERTGDRLKDRMIVSMGRCSH